MMDHSRGVCRAQVWCNAKIMGLAGSSVIRFLPDKSTALSASSREHNYSCHAKGKAHSGITQWSSRWLWFHLRVQRFGKSMSKKEVIIFSIKIWKARTSVVVVVRILQGGWVWSLVWGLWSHMPQDPPEKIKTRNNTVNKFNKDFLNGPYEKIF